MQLTPIEKAKELVDKFYVRVQFIDKYSYLTRGDEQFHSKELALMAVEDAILYHPFPNEPDERDIKFHNFWNEVKTEIINL